MITQLCHMIAYALSCSSRHCTYPNGLPQQSSLVEQLLRNASHIDTCATQTPGGACGCMEGRKGRKEEREGREGEIEGRV